MYIRKLKLGDGIKLVLPRRTAETQREGVEIVLVVTEIGRSHVKAGVKCDPDIHIGEIRNYFRVPKKKEGASR